MDWISLVELGYAQRGDLGAWLGELAECSQALLEGELGVAVQLFEIRGGRLETLHVAAAGPAADEIAAHARDRHQSATDAGLALFLRGGTRAGTMSREVFPGAPQERRGFEARGIADVLGLLALTGDGAGLAVSVPLRRERALTSSESRILGRVASHLGSGWRLRRALAREAGAPKAVVTDPSGRLEGPREGLDPAGERVLREAVVRAEAARRQAVRSSPERALDLWRGLVEGCWSLVDRFDADGRRFVVAVENRQVLGDPRGLSRREREVAEWVGLGLTDKEIAYTLGISESAVANAVARARKKLDLSRAELAAFFAPGGLRARLVELEVAGEPLLAASLPGFDSARLGALTDAEREVALLALAGHTNAHIAAARGRSAHTVANQLRSAYRKLGVASRSELAARLHGAGSGD